MWQIEISRKIQKKFLGFDKPVRNRILDYLEEIRRLDNPRDRGKALTGNLAGMWRWRVGDYRITAKIKSHVITIVIIDIDHRNKIYRA